MAGRSPGLPAFLIFRRYAVASEENLVNRNLRLYQKLRINAERIKDSETDFLLSYTVLVTKDMQMIIHLQDLTEDDAIHVLDKALKDLQQKKMKREQEKKQRKHPH